MRIGWLLVILAMFTISLNGTKPIVSLHANGIGASPTEIGFLVSAYAFFPMLLAIQTGKLLDKIGAKKLTLFGTCAMVIALTTPILSPTYLSLLFSQSIIGCATICVIISLQKSVGNNGGNRDKAIALFSLVVSSAEFIGPLYSSFIYEHFGFRSTFALNACITLLTVILILTLPKKRWGKLSKIHDAKHEKTWLLLKHPNLRKALIISGLVLSSKDLFVAYFPVYGTHIGLRPSEIGMVLSATALMAIVIRLFQFCLVNRIGRGLLLSVTLIMSALSFVLISFLDSFYLLLVMAGCLGLGLGLGQPISLVYAMNMSSVDRHGEVLGLRLTFNRVSQFTAPLLFGGIGGMIGVGSLFLLMGSTIFVTALFTRIHDTSQENENNHSSKQV